MEERHSQQGLHTVVMLDEPFDYFLLWLQFRNVFLHFLHWWFYTPVNKEERFWCWNENKMLWILPLNWAELSCDCMTAHKRNKLPFDSYLSEFMYWSMWCDLQNIHKTLLQGIAQVYPVKTLRNYEFHYSFKFVDALCSAWKISCVFFLETYFISFVSSICVVCDKPHNTPTYVKQHLGIQFLTNEATV